MSRSHENQIVQAYQQTLSSMAWLYLYFELDDQGPDFIDPAKREEGCMCPCVVDEGSGILWDDQGHIVTNHHVVVKKKGLRGNLLKVKVRFSGLSDSFEAEVVGSDPTNDLAVLKISDKQYKSNPKLANNPLKLLPRPIRKGFSKYLQVGQTCLAIRTVDSHSGTLTVGAISGLDVLVPSPTAKQNIYGCIQIDGM